MQVSVCSIGEESNARYLDQVRLAEQLGFHAFFHADGKWLRDPYVRLAAATQVSSRIGLGLCVTDPYTRHPALSAQAAATLTELAPGRLRVIMGAGARFESLPTVSSARPVQGIREGIALMRRLWSGERVTLDGEVIRFTAGKLDFRPQATPELYVASRGPRILGLAGEIADGVMIASFATPPGIAYAKSHIRQGLDAAGRDWPDLRLCSWLYTTLLEHEDDPIPDNIRRGISHVFWSSRPVMTAMVDELAGDATDEFRRFLRDAPHLWSPDIMAELRRLLPAGLFHTMALVGTPAQIIAKLKALEALGIQEAILWPFPRPDQEVEDVLIKLADTVLPAVAPRVEREAYRLVD